MLLQVTQGGGETVFPRKEMLVDTQHAGTGIVDPFGHLALEEAVVPTLNGGRSQARTTGQAALRNPVVMVLANLLTKRLGGALVAQEPRKALAEISVATLAEILIAAQDQPNQPLAAGGSSNVTISFTPSLAEIYPGSITFLSDGGGSTNSLEGYGFILAGSTNTSIFLVSGQPAFGFSVVSGATYRVQASTNLLQAPDSGFEDVAGPLTNRGSGSIIYTNTTAEPLRMFRIKSP